MLTPTLPTTRRPHTTRGRTVWLDWDGRSHLVHGAGDLAAFEATCARQLERDEDWDGDELPPATDAVTVTTEDHRCQRCGRRAIGAAGCQTCFGEGTW